MRKDKCGFFVAASCSSVQGHCSGDTSHLGNPNNICAHGDCSRHVSMQRTHTEKQKQKQSPGKSESRTEKIKFYV